MATSARSGEKESALRAVLGWANPRIVARNRTLTPIAPSDHDFSSRRKLANDMLIAESEASFTVYAASKRCDLRSGGSVRAVAEVWLSFYAEVRAEDAIQVEGAQGDMLLFEFGHRAELPGHYGACFYLNLTRQFISREGEDDDAIFQLIWLAEYEPTANLLELGKFIKWCDDLYALPTFRKLVFESSAFAALESIVPKKVEFYFSGV